MQMSSIKENLEKLQEVLNLKYSVENEIETLPKDLDNYKEQLDTLKREFIGKNEEYDNQKAKVDGLKAELEAADKEREANEKNMDATTTHREYEILDKLINESKEKEASIRRELQKEEKILDAMQEDLSNDEANINLTESEYNESSEKLNSDMESKKKLLDDLVQQEKELTSLIDDQEVISKFQRIIKRNAKGIVAVRGSVCTGCNMILPAQFANNVHHSKDSDDGSIFFCPYCSRVLYYEESGEDEENFIPTEEAGSLADDDESEEGSDSYDMSDEERDEDSRNFD